MAEKVQRLKGVMPQGGSPDGSSEQEAAVSELLRSLGKTYLALYTAIGIRLLALKF